MQRRTLLGLGAGAGTLLALAGWGLSAWQPGLQAQGLAPDARALWRAVAGAVLQAQLPPAGTPERETALAAWLQRLEASLLGLAPATRRELSDLMAVLGTAPGRRWLAGLARPWAEADDAEVAGALQSMRQARLAVRQQAYHALRDLTHAAWFADPVGWRSLGYPGPRTLR